MMFYLNTFFVLLFIVCIDNVKSEVYNIRIGGTVDLPCNLPNGVIAEAITWLYDYGGQEARPVVEWIQSKYLRYGDEYTGRADLTTSSGNIQIRQLQLADDGKYTCQYDGVPFPPSIPSVTHTVVILVPPTDDTVEPSGLDNNWVDRDEPYTLKCRVYSINPKGSVYWRIDGETRTDTGQDFDKHNGNNTFWLEGTLTTTFNNYTDPVQVDCLVTEEGKHNQVLLTKQYRSLGLLWKLKTKVISQTTGDAIQGNSYTLKCDVTDGNPRNDVDNYVYQWKKGGQVQGGKTGSTYIIPSLNYTEHNKTFTCASDNGLGMGADSEGYPLNVLYVPGVKVTIPASGVEGYSVTLGCQAEGGNPTQLTDVKWKKDGQPLTRDFVGGTPDNPSITLNNLVKSDAGSYTCVISNKAGSRESDEKSMDMLFKPQGQSSLSISTEGERSNIAVGESVDFTCSHPGDSNPDPNRFTFSEDNEIKQNDTSSQWQGVSYLNVRDRVEISCVASNLYGVAGISSIIPVSVEANATVEYPKQDMVESPVFNDPNVYLDCLGAGNQRSVSWKKQGQAVSLVDWKVEQDGTESGDYIFNQTEAYRKKYQWKVAEAKCDTVNKHTGTYTCLVDAKAGNKDTQVTRNWDITVQYPPLPTIGSYYNPSVAEAGDNVILTCDVCSFPEERSYLWSFNGEEVGTERTLHINNIDENGFGNYSCTASNTIDGDVRTAVLIYHVRARGGPSAVQDLNTAEVTSQTVNVTFIPGFNGGLKQNFTVEYKLEADPDEPYQEVLKGVEDPNPTDPDEASGPRIPVNARVEDLDAEQTYTFRVRSENDFHDESKRYSPWAYVNASTVERPEVSLNRLVYTFPSEGKSERIEFSWEIVQGQPESLTLKYRLATVNTRADESEWTVMVEGVNPADEEYSNETSENPDPKKDYVFILVTMEAQDVNGGASKNFNVYGPESPNNPVGSPIGAIIGGILGVVLLVGVIVGAVLVWKGRINIPKREKAGSSDSAFVLQTVPDNNEVPGVQNEYVGNGSPYASGDELPLQSNSRNPPAVLVEPAYEDVNNDKHKGARKRATSPKTSPPAPPGTKPSAAGPAATSPAGQGPIYATANPKGKPKPAPKPQVPAPNEADEEEDPYGTAPPIPDKYIDGDIYSPEHWEPGICIESEEGNYVRVIHHGPSIYIPSSTPDLIYDTIDFSVQLPKDEDSD